MDQLHLKLIWHGFTEHLGLSVDCPACTEVNGTWCAEGPFEQEVSRQHSVPNALPSVDEQPDSEATGMPGTSVFMHADDTTTLSSGPTIEVVQHRAQQAADVLTQRTQK